MNLNKLKPKHILIFLFFAFFMFLVLLVLITNSFSGNISKASSSPSEISVLSDWSYHWVLSDSEENFNYISSETTTGISMWTSYVFPGKPHNPKGCHQIWIKGLLPDVNAEDATLRFRAPQQSLELYLDGVRIYSFGTIDTSNTQRTPGSIWHLVTLPSGWQGKELYFRTYAPVEEYSGYMIDLEIGSKSTHVLNIISENMPSFVIGIALILLGMLLIFIVFAGILQQKGIISLGLFSILIGIWYIAERKIPQLFIASPLLLIYIANVSIFLMPAAFLSFTRNILASDSTLEGRVLKRLSQFFYPFTAIMLLLDLSGTYSCLRTVLFLHVMLVISALIVILIILKAALNKNRYAWIFLVGVLFFAIANLYDAYNLFYSEAQNAHPITIGHWGTLMFILSLASITGLQMKTLINQLKINSKENEINYKSLFNNMSEGFLHTRVIMDKDNQPEDYMVMEANPSLLSNLGLPKESVIGRLVGDILPEIGTLFPDSARPRTTKASVEAWLENSNQLKLRDKWYKASSFIPKTGFVSIILSDITDMKNTEERARQQAYTDTMTGFFNRTYFEDVMSRMGRFINDLKPLTFIMIDVDGLKITNDTFGHSSGDELLKDTAGIISETLKGQGIVSRIGGDEFCIILPDTSYEAATKIREDLVVSVERFNKRGPQIPINLSVGIATSDRYSIEDIYNIYKRSDDDMYQYKISQSGSEKSKIVDMLQIALSERDYVSQGHVERLVEMVEKLSESMGLADTVKRNLILLAKVHDLGKIGVPDEILFKPGRLTPDEFEKMKRHVNIGYNMATRSKDLVHVATLILHHHERWDGNGYPAGLKKEQIPLECRILAVLDSYDAMTSIRPYFSGMSREDALAEVKRCKGSQFDPDITEEFLVMADKGII